MPRDKKGIFPLVREEPIRRVRTYQRKFFSIRRQTLLFEPYRMKKHLPSPTELAIFATLAFILAGVAVTSGSVGGALALISCPLFFTCAILGMHRSGRFAPRAVPVELSQDVSTSSAVTD
jgi:hypothetical protein